MPWWKELPTWAKWAAGVVGLMIVLAIFSSSPDDQTGNGGSKAEKSEIDAKVERPKKPLSKYDQLKATLKDEFDDQFRSFQRSPEAVVVGLNTEDNLSNSLVKIGIKKDAARVFELIYKNAHLEPPETITQFYMPLINKSTGRESENIVAVYALKRSAALNIEWKNKDFIDWDTYRTMLHQVLR